MYIISVIWSDAYNHNTYQWRAHINHSMERCGMMWASSCHLMDAQEVEPPLKRPDGGLGQFSMDILEMWSGPLLWHPRPLTLDQAPLQRHVVSVGLDCWSFTDSQIRPEIMLTIQIYGSFPWRNWRLAHMVQVACSLKLQGWWISFTEGSRRTGGLNKVEKAEGQQTWMWVPVGAFDLNCGVGYIWTRKGSNRILFRQLLWLTENMRRAWLHWGRIYVVWPRRPSWSCFWKSFWAAF